MRSGVAGSPSAPYVAGDMSYLSRFSPVRAWRDLRLFFAQRGKIELGFAALALFLTGMILAGFYVDSRMEKPYKREIIYVESWPADRTDEQIKAQQKIDQAAREKRMAELEKKRAERQAQFKRLDDKLESWGL